MTTSLKQNGSGWQRARERNLDSWAGMLITSLNQKIVNIQGSGTYYSLNEKIGLIYFASVPNHFSTQGSHT